MQPRRLETVSPQTWNNAACSGDAHRREGQSFDRETTNNAIVDMLMKLRGVDPAIDVYLFYKREIMLSQRTENRAATAKWLFRTDYLSPASLFN